MKVEFIIAEEYIFPGILLMSSHSRNERRLLGCSFYSSKTYSHGECSIRIHFLCFHRVHLHDTFQVKPSQVIILCIKLLKIG